MTSHWKSSILLHFGRMCAFWIKCAHFSYNAHILVKMRAFRRTFTQLGNFLVLFLSPNTTYRSGRVIYQHFLDVANFVFWMWPTVILWGIHDIAFRYSCSVEFNLARNIEKGSTTQYFGIELFVHTTFFSGCTSKGCKVQSSLDDCSERGCNTSGISDSDWGTMFRFTV